MDADLIVAGAGPAGSACARTAAALGLKTLLIDRARFPRAKPCGGGLAPRAVADITRIFGLDCRDLLGVPRYRLRPHLHPAPRPGRTTACRHLSLESPAPLVHVTSRVRLDHHLARAAAAAGATLLEDTAVVAWGQDESAVWVSLRTHQGGGPVYRTVHGRYLVGADGADSTVARGLGRPRPGPLAFCLEVAVPLQRARAEELTSGAVDFHFGLVRGGYGWVFPGPAGLAAGVGRLWDRRARRVRSELEAALHRLLGVYGLTPGHPSTSPPRGWLVPLGGCRRPWGRGRVLTAGDAAGVANPLTGEGIGPALRSGEAVARHIAARLAAEGRCPAPSGAAGGDRLAAALGAVAPPDYLDFLRSEHHLGQAWRLRLVQAAARLGPTRQVWLFRRPVFGALVREMQRTL